MPRQQNSNEKPDFSQMPKEMLLEFVQQEDGKMVLRPANNDEVQPLLSIEFSDEIKEMLGRDIHFIGQSMVQAALHSFMHKQMAHWHAHVYDEEPVHYS